MVGGWGEREVVVVGEGGDYKMSENIENCSLRFSLPFACFERPTT